MSATLNQIRKIMSRYNPNDTSPNPTKRWFQWNGGNDGGDLKYYDKEAQAEVKMALPFSFILLDRLSTIKGWHDASESAIWSNEVRRTQDEPFTVKAFKMKEVIAQGFYSNIKDKVKSAGGKFNMNLYLAFEDEGQLEIGSLILHGAPMSAWIEFEKKHKKDVYAQGVAITSFKEGKKGGITFRTPVFELVTIEPEADDQAGKLQKELQTYLTKYLNRSGTKTDAADAEYDQTPEEEEELEDIPF